MTTRYRYQVLLHGVDKDRQAELKTYLRQLMPSKGENFFKELFETLTEETPHEVYHTNDVNDARRTAWTITTYGGLPSINSED